MIRVQSASSVLSPRLMARCVMALSAAALFASAQQPVGWGSVTGWFCLVPLLAAIRGLDWRLAAALGALFGTAANLLVFHWIFAVPGFRLHHGLILAIYLAVYPAAWAATVRAFGRDKSHAWIAVTALGWMLLEHLRSRAGFLALPWGTLAQSQVDSVVAVQAASVIGEPGLAFMVAWGNALIWQLLQGAGWRAVIVRALPLLLTVLFGAASLLLESRATAPQITLAALHTAFPSFGAQRITAEERMLVAVSAAQVLPDSGIDLVVFPESTFVNTHAAPGVHDALQDLANRTGAAIVAGEATSMKFEHQPRSGTSRTEVRNGALVFEPERPPQRYAKEILLPFAEYSPLRGAFIPPPWLVPRPPLELVRGDGPSVIVTHAAGPIGLMVCWESVFADHARRSQRASASVLVQLANEGWFSSIAAGEQHNVTVRMRAVESRMPAAVASNAGPAAVIDRMGRVVERTDGQGDVAWAVARVNLRTGVTLYARLGDSGVLAAVVAGLLLAVLRNRDGRSTKSKGPTPRTGTEV